LGWSNKHPFMVRCGPERLFYDRVLSITVVERSITVFWRSRTVLYGRVWSVTVMCGSFTIRYGPVRSFYGWLRFKVVRYGSVRKRYFMHAVAVLAYKSCFRMRPLCITYLNKICNNSRMVIFLCLHMRYYYAKVYVCVWV
jgi:hypothetical protein